MNDFDEAIKYIRFTEEYLRSINETWYADYLSDAIELLKPYYPSVIRFDEIDNYEVLWLEVKDVRSEEGLAPWVKTQNGRWFSPLICGPSEPDMNLCTTDEYGTIVRCWTARPSDDQRKATPWQNMVNEEETL